MSDVAVDRAPNLEQLRAIEEPGVVFVSAGAGTGKTTVIVERFCRAVCERGLDVDSILVITYTERAAGELRGRIRKRLAELGRHDLARQLDGAWISTIHGFCRRLLKAHPFAAGIDPRFRILDDSQGRVLRGEAFRSALEEFCGDDPARLRLLASYGGRRLRQMLTGVHETLRSSGLPLRLEASGDPGLADRIEELRSAAEALGQTDALRFLEGPPGPEALLDLSDLRVRGGDAEAYEEARRAVEQAALEALAVRDREELQELMLAYDRAYRAAKDRESALDFEDLQLLAREVLEEHEEIRERESWRFRSVMVDEFQDTNRLQCELVDLLARDEGELFFVGDEFQSIYRFRHADVEVFRERREQAGGVLALTQNYRSRPEVLDVINHLFAADFGDSFRPLAAAGRFPDPAFGPAVELLVTDKDSYRETGTHWRSAEARHIAKRVKALVDAEEATPGEIVLLFAAGTDARLYEEELRAVGLPTFRATGRDYYRQQQVVDLLAYLRLLHNRYDDEALVSVLASPFVGVSNDALVLLRRAAPRRPLFVGLEKQLPDGLSERDTRLFQAFRQRYERLAAQTPSLTLERLCEQIVCEHDYDLAVLAQWDGRRRYANLRKLGRLARSYEELRGPDVEGFVRFVAEQDAVGASELEAAAEEEGTDVIRLLTIHSAKGLEFKVVVVADAGRDRARPDADEILCLPDGRLGFRVADPASGRRLSTADYEDVKTAERDAEEAERRRLYYVAMTRAIDRLIVSGAIGEGRADAATPIGWVLERLEATELDDAESGPVEIDRDGARLLLRVDRYVDEPVDEQAAPAAEQLELFAVSPNGDAALEAPTLAPLAEVPAPPLHRARRLSYSALSLFERCSYRYFAERVVGLRPKEAGLRPAEGEGGLAATEIGDAVHVLLEEVDLLRPETPANLDELVGDRYPDVTEEELARIRAFVTAYCESELAARLAGLDGAAAERPFAFEHDGVLLHGRLDVLHRDGPRALVVDYKTNWLEDRSPSEIVEHDYRLQRLVYALACFRAGAKEVEVVYQFLERPDDLVTVCCKVEEVAALEAELSKAIAEIQAGEFRPTPSEFVCADCPALDLVCAGPRLRNA
ncbi:MAG TPA: UvrD-helicase domain-containing protein [Gaiellaceae bacterium]|nr:UvrD-helicase domain-containing protein [Gaiellaceae bacterium]